MPGYLRGSAFHGKFAIVGTSKSRENQTFSGFELDENLKSANAKRRCAVQIIDLNSGDVVHWIRIKGVVSELYDFVGLPQTWADQRSKSLTAWFVSKTTWERFAIVRDIAALNSGSVA